MLKPCWPVPDSVLALSTGRFGGVSEGDFRGLNLGGHVQDDPVRVEQNRQRLMAALPEGAALQWLEQVHGTEVVTLPRAESIPVADASYSDQPGQFCAVMTADCLPVLLCSQAGDEVAAAHAGWRGLQAGVLERSVERFRAAPPSLMAWLGPAIGPTAFEVGPEVREAFLAEDAKADSAFQPHGDRFLADLYQLARQRLQRLGVTAIYGGDLCTWSDPSRFYSYRRQSRTGRQASLIGIRPQA
ncbi:peptidoglycan editing factor PgeF [Ferrimonas marina]|uniref:Purine nucleoside phosphorylase n=1 Tax=Ferrimonas marina TaxID=299255 RepID=A0A1M5WYU3_9GAMM|nr:peptidoglycan editing factor PgeF [Ferrimonas marina]SHH92856.1 conserved hypothetical protein [Ferrimonas marina]